MAKHQLTLSPDYVLDWTYLEAVREVFQNALDNETQTPDNEMFFDYKDETLLIGNKTSILTLETLLLGHSSKRDSEDTIGRHGEGYKVALMVFLREGKELTIYNYGAREIWKTRLIKSRKFNGALITEVDVQKKAIFQSVPSHNLMFEIKGITQEEYNNIVEHNLHLQEGVEKFTTQNGMGDILTDPKHQGHVYINGLYVTTNERFKYGYDIKPKYMSLDRDRKLIDTFDLAWTTSKMWRYVDQADTVASLLMEDAVDVRHIKSRRDYSFESVDSEAKLGVDEQISQSLVKAFKEEHGDKAIPVYLNSDLQKISRSHKDVQPVMVTEAVSDYLQEELDLPEELTTSPKERLKQWFDSIQDKLSEEEVSDFEIILEELSEF